MAETTDLQYGDIGLMAERDGVIANAHLEAAVALLRDALKGATIWVRTVPEVESVQNPTPTGRTPVRAGQVVLELSDVEPADAEATMQEAAGLLEAPVAVVYDSDADQGAK